MKKIVIIGSGPAGLTTAYEILKQSKEYEVIVIEKENQVGGISKTISINDEYLVDTGIHRFFSKSDKVNQIWNELLPIQGKPAYDDIVLKRQKEYAENGPDPEKDDETVLIKDRVTRILYNKKFFDYPVTLNWNTLKNLGFKKLVRVAVTYTKALIVKKDETSLENFYINRFGKELYETFFKNYTEKVWGLEPAKISAEWGAQRVKGISIFEIVADIFRKKFKNKKTKHVSLIEKFYYPKLGAGQMWQTMADKIEEMGGKVLLNSQVENIIIKDKKIDSVVINQNGELTTLHTDALVSSMPIKNLVEKLGQDQFNTETYNAAINLPYRDFLVVYLLVDKLKLKNNTKIPTIGNIIPDDWVYIQEDSVKMGRMQIFNNWSPYLFKNKEDVENKALISLEYFASVGDNLWSKSEDEMIDFAIDEARQIGIIDNVTIYAKKMFKIEKAYPAYFGTYEKMTQIRNELDQFENLYCVGRNGQHRYNNMDHSMLTGIETADSIINNEKDKSKIWSVNTEKEYHEVKEQ